MINRVKEILISHYKKVVTILSIITLILIGLLCLQLRHLTFLKQQSQTYKQFTVVKKSMAAPVWKEPECLFNIQAGDTIEKIAQRLDEQEIIEKNCFLSYLQKEQIFIKGKVYNKGMRKYILEGYFFPGSYELYFDITPQEVCEVLINPYLIWIEKIHSQEESRDIVTIASMIEKEAATNKDRYMIAGVIMNRLNAEMRLQIDATVLYALGYHKSALTKQDLKIESPYNTYFTSTLPPGPICSPSYESLEAALRPEIHSYFYYVVETYGQPHHTFSKTYEEHLEKVEQYKESQKR
ncbi:MAG: endolytic transglycosylase MltG [Epulopiscium sp.]|nr:endolytic transglycosylase MltG [Candidatus Epulonipiscium sp.]